MINEAFLFLKEKKGKRILSYATIVSSLVNYLPLFLSFSRFTWGSIAKEVAPSLSPLAHIPSENGATRSPFQPSRPRSRLSLSFVAASGFLLSREKERRG